MNNIIRRLSQPSTWFGIATLAVQAYTGVLTPETVGSVPATFGLIGGDA